MKLPITSIIIPDRMRKDYGDIAELATSISQYGQIQPIVLDQNNNLIAGGRRLAAHVHLNLKEIDVVYRETLTPDENKMLELEENVRRKEMSWQERVLAIDEIHNLKSRDAHLSSTSWGLRETGELLGVALCSVAYATQVASKLRANDEEVRKCGSVREALQLLMSRKEDEANKLLAKTIIKPSGIDLDVMGILDIDADDIPAHNGPENPDVPSIHLGRQLFLGDSIDIMRKMPDACVDHVISDPPYGIDMDNLAQENQGMANIERTADEHTIAGNEHLFAEMLPQMFRLIKPNGFCILWCDITQWQYLADLGIMAGFRVQRWPITWVKTHPCMNQCAQYNFTKSTEIAIVMRKASATLVQPQSGCHVLASNDTMGKAGRHPFAKPTAIWNYIFQAVTIRGQTVLDPFAGVGSSTVAAIKYGLNPIAIELVEDHYSQLVENVRSTYNEQFKGKVAFV